MKYVKEKKHRNYSFIKKKTYTHMNCGRVKETCTEAYLLLSYARKEEYQRKSQRNGCVKKERMVSERRSLEIDAGCIFIVRQ